MLLGEDIRQGLPDDLESEASRKIITTIDKWREGGKIWSAQRRWIFELIQNALDVKLERNTDRRVKIEIIYNENEIIFRHNAGYFKPKEFRALIYAYSTKPYAREAAEAGRFASGLLVTHIVSKKVGLKGTLKKDNDFFEFNTEIDRREQDIEKLAASFLKSFTMLNDARKTENNLDQYWTEYKYEIVDNEAKNAATIGLNEMKRSLPCLFAFNDIEEIKINNEKYLKVESKDNGLSTFKVGNTEFLTRSYHEIDIGIIVNSQTNETQNLENSARIYVKGLPIIETGEYAKIPFIIHSRKFDVLEDRDTLKKNDENSRLLNESIKSFYHFASIVCKSNNLKALYRIVDFELVPENIISQNSIWFDFNNSLIQTFKSIVCEIPIVDTLKGKQEIRNTIFPITGRLLTARTELFVAFCSLVEQVKVNIPQNIEDWMNVVEKLKVIGDFTNYLSLYDLEAMRNEIVTFMKDDIQNSPTFDTFGRKFNINDSRGFLLAFFKIADELFTKNIIASGFIDNLIPNQNGVIGPLKIEKRQLYIDADIPEELKSIVHRIGWVIKDELLHRDFEGCIILQDFLRDKMDTGSTLEKLFKSKNLKSSKSVLEKDRWPEEILAWLDLFWWCIRNNAPIKHFPILTKDNNIQEISDLENETFVIPFIHMGIDEEYEEIYPESKVIHKKYFEAMTSNDIDNLKKYKIFVTNLPVYKNSLTLEPNKLESILIQSATVSKVKHEIQSPEVVISILPFWSDISGRISTYQDRAILLFKFIINYIIEYDPSWEKEIKVNCTCIEKGHNIIPSHWLASLISDLWVPYKTEEDGQERIDRRKATKESIDNLLGSMGVEELLKSKPHKIAKLLHYFGFDELYLKIKLYSIDTGKPENIVKNDLSKITDIFRTIPNLADIATHDPLSFKEAISAYQDRLANEPIKRENKIIGENVEKIIGKILSNRGYKVEIVYKGGDLEIWPETEGCDCGLIEIESCLLEVKFTSGTRIHLSKAQSDMARSKKVHYFVLVLENVGDLRSRLKNMDENNIPDDLVTIIEGESQVVENIHAKLGALPNPDEIEPDIYGYWVKKKLWINNYNFIEKIARSFADNSIDPTPKSWTVYKLSHRVYNRS